MRATKTMKHRDRVDQTEKGVEKVKPLKRWRKGNALFY